MSLGNHLAGHVSDELFWEPKLDNPASVGSANDGITLRGTVGSLRASEGG